MISADAAGLLNSHVAVIRTSRGTKPLVRFTHTVRDAVWFHLAEQKMTPPPPLNLKAEICHFNGNQFNTSQDLSSVLEEITSFVQIVCVVFPFL